MGFTVVMTRGVNGLLLSPWLWKGHGPYLRHCPQVAGVGAAVREFSDQRFPATVHGLSGGPADGVQEFPEFLEIVVTFVVESV